MKVKIQKRNNLAIIPTRGSDRAAAYDLYACISKGDGTITIPPHQTVMIGTGVSMVLSEGYFAAIYARSGLSTKQGLRPANCVGVCDEDYRGEYMVALHNDFDIEQVVSHGDRIAQLVIQKRYDIEFEIVEELDDTARGAGGFGSTGI